MPESMKTLVTPKGVLYLIDAVSQFMVGSGAAPEQFRRQSQAGANNQGGDSNLRTLLVLGARSMLISAKGKKDPVSRRALTPRRD